MLIISVPSSDISSLAFIGQMILTYLITHTRCLSFDVHFELWSESSYG